MLFERIESDIAPMRERYEALMADPAAIETMLQQGARKARAIATPKIVALREALGLRSSHFRINGGGPAEGDAEAGQNAALRQFSRCRW